MKSWRLAAVVCGLMIQSVHAGATFDELAASAAAARLADRIPEAIDLYRQALQIKPDWPTGWWYLGTLYYDSDRYADGRQAFSEFVKLAANPPGWAFLGLCEFETGDYSQAQEHLQKAVDGGLDPDIRPVARFHLAMLLTLRGHFDQAWHWYRPLVEQGVHDPTFIGALGLNALEKPMLPAAAPPDQREFIMAMGGAAWAWLSGDKDKAEPVFHTLLAAYPSAPGVHNLYAKYLLSARPDEAMPELRRELELNPRSVEARAMAALLLLKAGQAYEALAFASKAVADGPDFALAQYAYGLTLADPHQAIEHFETAKRLDPGNFEYHVALAGGYAKCGRDDEARRERSLAIRLAKESAPK